jgi:WD40 repeat protein
MGAFYGSVQVRTGDREAVRSALEGLASKDRRFLLGPVLNGWVGVYPNGAGQDFGVAQELASRLGSEILAIVVHDDDVFAYEYFRNAKRLDQYNSVPDYFGDVSAHEKAELAGRPEMLAHLASDRARFEALATRIATQADDREFFVSDLLEEFAAVFDIRNALTSYEYLLEHEETDEIELWDEFLHVPDLAAEQAQSRAAEAALQEQKDDLARQGSLLAERGGQKRSESRYPQCCPAPDGSGFLVAWSDHSVPKDQPGSLELHGPPWASGPSVIPLPIGWHVYGMALSPSGRYLATANASGDWTARLWDLDANRLVAEVPQVRAVSDVGFASDESMMISVSSNGDDGKVILTPIGSGEEKVFPLARAMLAQVHPSGKWLVASDSFSRLFVIEIATGRVERTRLVGGKSVPSPLELMGLAQAQAAMAAIDVDAVEQEMRKQQEKLLKMIEKSNDRQALGSIDDLKKSFEEQIVELRKQYGKEGTGLPMPTQDRGMDGPRRMLFDPTGERLFLATDNGVRVYPWGDILGNDGDLPRPVLAVDSQKNADDPHHGSSNRGNFTYDLDHDPERDRLIFAGLEGCVRYLDLATGKSGILLEPPKRVPILRLALSRNRETLAITIYPDMYVNSRNKRGPALQFWDYRKLAGD